jgi:hypothetical protein
MNPTSSADYLALRDAQLKFHESCDRLYTTLKNLRLHWCTPGLQSDEAVASSKTMLKADLKSTQTDLQTVYSFLYNTELKNASKAPRAWASTRDSKPG